MTEKDVSNKIDELINQLKKDLLNVPYNSRGVWDRVKNWWHNLTKTPNNPSNPYYLTNKFGALGRVNPESAFTSNTKPEIPKKELEDEIPSEEEFKLGTSKSESRISLKQYTVLKESAKKLEEKISFMLNENQMSDNLKNLEMFRIIDNWAVGFKKEIMSLIKGEVNLSKEDLPPKEETESPAVKPKKTQDGPVLFKTWIKNVDNVHFFIEIVNKIFSDSVRYSRSLPNISAILVSKGVASPNPKQGDEGTPLHVSVRQEILRMMKKELELGTKSEDSIFKPAVWSWAKNLPSWGKKKKEDKEENGDFEEAPPSEPGDAGVIPDEGSEEFLNI